MSKEHQKYQSKIQKIRRNFSLTEVSTSKVAVVNPFIPSIYLPSSLFYRPKKKTRKAAKGRMDVTSAKVSERASSTPSSELKRKTIIVTDRAFNAFIAKWKKNQ